jgi:hypothetical protein
MNKHDILNIKLGARQIPLVYEKDPVKEQEAIASCVRGFAQRHGEVEFHQFIEYVKEIRRDLTVGTGGPLGTIVVWGPLPKGTTSPKAPNLFRLQSKLQIDSRPARARGLKLVRAAPNTEARFS